MSLCTATIHRKSKQQKFIIRSIRKFNLKQKTVFPFSAHFMKYEQLKFKLKVIKV